MKYLDLKFYEVLDCGDGYKIERFNDYILKRPDPQAIWHMQNLNKYKYNAIYHRSNKGGGEWEFIDLPKSWQVEFDISDRDKMVMNLKPFSFKHTGIFPEQAYNWKFIYDIITNYVNFEYKNKIFNVLNLFAYTGGASIACAKAGAFVTHVDSSKGIVTWAKENAESSKLKTDSIRWIVDDCKKFVEREIRRGKFYDGVILDPPSYGRGKDGEVWKIEDDLYDLLYLIKKLFNANSKFLLLNSYTTGLQCGTMEYMLNNVFTNDFGGDVNSFELGLKVRDSGLVLPQGSSTYWTKK